MKFFIPDRSPKEGEKLYKALRKSAGKSETGAISEARIQSITYKNGDRTVQGTVGVWDALECRMVIAILESGDSFLIFERGRLSDPIVVGKNEVSQVELFDS